jgi:hypothetical protein
MARAPTLPREILAAIRQAAISMASAVMRVEVTGNVGYLFFLEGELVHGSTLELEGEPAVSAMLSWREAEIAWCERRWPRERSVFRSWSQLAEATPVAAPPLEDERPTAPVIPIEAPVAAPAAAPEPHFPSSFGLRQTFSRADFKNALRISAGGNVGDSRGSTAHLKPILSSSLTLGDSLGAAFGLGPLVAAEASAPGFHRLVARSSEDGVAAETGGGSALQLARAFLKL